ncbi:MAG: efflux RND transporter periplasmic adaptor subunit [Calditrichaeota bacterium]|nr:efflux RND transporter periplasmic adaptor subunit [Calditrichota bacterium]
MNKKKIFIIIGVIIILGVFIIANLKKSEGGGIEVTVEKVQRGDITQVVSGPGKIQPEVEVKISANVSAEITGLYVTEGDYVHKGQLLVELDRTKYVAATDRARSTKKSAEANLTKAKNDYGRVRELYDKKLTSLADLENAQANLELAESQLEQAVAGLHQAEDDLSKTKLFSPLEGTVTKINKEVGEIALGSMFQADVIMVVADLSRMETVAEIDENDIILVNEGDTTDISVDAIPDTTFLGKVREIAHTATTRGFGTQEEVTNFEVKISILNPLPTMRPGMSATVDIRTESKRNILQTPIQAVTVREKSKVFPDSTKVEQKGKKEKSEKNSEDELVECVFIVEDGIAKIAPVKTGISSDTYIEIKSGVAEGQMVVTGSYRALSKTLENGSRVKINKKSKFSEK